MHKNLIDSSKLKLPIHSYELLNIIQTIKFKKKIV